MEGARNGEEEGDPAQEKLCRSGNGSRGEPARLGGGDTALSLVRPETDY